MFDINLSSQSKRVVFSINHLSRLTKNGMNRALFEIGKDLVASARKDILKKPKHGRVYLLRLRGRRVRHRASAPGEAPANFTGALKNSIKAKQHGSNELVFGAGNVTDLNYAKTLEEGSHIRRIEPRPYLITAIKNNDRNIQKRLERYITKSIKAGGK